MAKGPLEIPPHMIPRPKYEAHEFDTRFGGPNCRCPRTGPENTYEVSEACGLHCSQDLTSEDPVEAVISAVKDAAPAAYDPPPDHYASGAGIDPWAVWDAFDLDRYTANAVKYLLRAGKKDIAPRLDDLIKARNYINKAIEREQAK
jgi:hypothetical protein